MALAISHHDPDPRDDELALLRAEVEELRLVIKLIVATASDHVPEGFLTELSEFDLHKLTKSETLGR